jgi:hypothetical protein
MLIALAPIEHARHDHVSTVKTLGVVSLLARKLEGSNVLTDYAIAAGSRDDETKAVHLLLRGHIWIRHCLRCS